jgi:TP901 family phage tail tape measure protein
MAISAATLAINVTADTSDAEKGIKGFSGKMNSAAKSLGATGGIMTATITAPLVGIATAALSMAADFEQSLNILQQVTGATTSEMESLTEQALMLGATTSFSAGEAAQGMLELGKAGMDTNEIMAAIPGVMDLAAAAGVGLGEAAGITAAALNAFGLEASESSRVANLLAGAANASAADITDLAQGLKQAGFAFDLANQPIENLVASLAILTNVGLTGSDAGTALKNAFMRMMNPTKEAASLMRELGITFYDAEGNMRQLPQIIDILNQSMANLTPQQRDAALATIFLSDGMKAMIPLMDAGANGFNDMVTEVSKAGAATDVANARMQGLRGGIEYLKGSIDSFLIGTAMPFLGMLGGLARSAGDAITAFGALPQPIIDATLAFAGVLAAAGPLMLTLAGVAKAFAFLTGPVGLVIAAVAALAAAWAANVGGIQQITAAASMQAQEHFGNMLTSAQLLASGIATAFGNTKFPSLQELWAQFQAGDFQAIANTIRNTAFELMVNLDAELDIKGQAKHLAGLIQQRLAEINQLGALMVQAIGQSISSINWGQLSINAAGMIDALTNAISSANWSALGASLVQGIRAGTNSVMAADVTWAEDFANNFAASVRGAFTSIEWGTLDTALIGLATAVREAIYGLLSGIGKELNLSLPKINWDAIMQSFSWSDWMTTLRWDTWVGTLSWDDFVAGLEWPSFISSLSWGSFVNNLSWSSFVESLSWSNFIPDISWSSFVPSLDWGRFISALTGGGASPSHNSPGVGSGGSIGGGNSNGPASGEAFGTASGVSVQIASVTMASNMDVHSMASTLAREIGKRMR